MMPERRGRWLLEWLAKQGWTLVAGRVDSVSPDGGRGVAIVDRLLGRRDLDAVALRVARWLAEKPSREAAIVALETQMSENRLRTEWRTIGELLRRDVTRRMALVAAGLEGGKGGPRGWLAPIEERVCQHEAPRRSPNRARRAAVSTMSYEVLKLVVRHFLLKSGPIHRNRLMKESGASYPTVARALARMEEQGELERLRDRRVVVPAFPQRTWQEILSLAPTLRPPIAYRDASGRKSDPAALLRRLESLRPERVALGGVAAARRWDEHFDLHGLPRLDVIWHLPVESTQPSFVRQLDSALAPARSRLDEPVVVVHVLRRREALFRRRPDGGIDIADPVETLLDLVELRLSDQADELIRRLSERNER